MLSWLLFMLNIFWICSRFSGCLIYAYYTRIWMRAVNCEFHNTEREILAQVIQGCTLKQFLNKARAIEITDDKVAEKENDNWASSMATKESMNQRREGNKPDPPNNATLFSVTPTSFAIIQSANIVVVHTHTFCPTKRKKCNTYHKLNHFLRVFLLFRQNKNIRKISSKVSLRSRSVFFF